MYDRAVIEAIWAMEQLLPFGHVADTSSEEKKPTDDEKRKN
jgi:hypothetical protein